MLLLLPPLKKHLRLAIYRYINLSLIISVTCRTTRLLYSHRIVAHIMVCHESLWVPKYASLLWFPPQSSLFILCKRKMLHLRNTLSCGRVFTNSDRVKH